MLTLYLAALAFGLVMTGVSLLGHGDGHDSDAESGLDHEHDSGNADDSEGDAYGPLSLLTSIRFWSYGLGAFGMAGATLYALGFPGAWHLPAAIGVGLAAGAGVSWLFRRLQRTEVLAPPDSSNVVGIEGEVVLPLLPGKTGKIRVQIGGQDYEFPANGGEEDQLPQKSRVVVIRMNEGTAYVRPAPWKD
jgi:membrane protein implicated in regulation of membrane protease activity